MTAQGKEWVRRDLAHIVSPKTLRMQRSMGPGSSLETLP